ncbi:MAG: hypothetical protein CFH21_00333 [Alphaproteobacteria bacterium MarineAlpha5_Bin11]|nr:hypothetical protein [Pelagibacteraceae bacterium]PPR44443.1 MAG: hypothetical protein CFH21_00333 [Alphaproteobacteria bacterium MarineAlpha5_Bin11]PPR51881.1 MAG: hypothetical protein CFH20_00300 [Alphaproteobacteria bacterium MarineAlpha5_Bin10]|tara:strand:- start:11276 stop:12868 length:1593 start_codon:yes stop_codon:yes gene_type:complete
MKSILYKFIKFIFTSSFIYKVYLNASYKKEFKGVEDFDPINIKKKPLSELMKIDDNFFSSYQKKLVSIKMHSFEWLKEFKATGGLELLKKSRKIILDWNSSKYNFKSNIWSEIIVARRMINLSNNFDFFGNSASKIFKKKIGDLVYLHYKFLKIQVLFYEEKSEINIEISKSLLLISKVFNENDYFNYLLKLIQKQITSQINDYGFHKSINVVEHAKFIHQLIEIKNILLFYDHKIWPQFHITIDDMITVLNNMFHKDSSLALFNGTNNKNIDYVQKIANFKKDLKVKDLFNIKDGLIVLDAGQTKIFFDVTRPNSKLLNKNLHSGTLSFEFSHKKEKIITNCGSPEKYYGKNQVFFRYSAAHSTLTINDTNISELSEINSYKRIPKKIIAKTKKNKSSYEILGSHNGYSNNYNILIKRILEITNDGKYIRGFDQIISLKKINKNNNFKIRFHLMPTCECVVTNNNKKVIIKTKNNVAWEFESQNSSLSIEESIYIGQGNLILKTNQIVLSGLVDNINKTINWKFKVISK